MALLFTDKQFVRNIEHPTLASIEEALNSESINGIEWRYLKSNSPLLRNIKKIDWAKPSDSMKLFVTMAGFKGGELLATVVLSIDVAIAFTNYRMSAHEHNLAQYLTGFNVVDVTCININPQHRNKGIAKGLLTAIWKEDIPLTIQPTSYLQSFFAGEEAIEEVEFNNPAYSTVSYLFKVYNLTHREPSYRLTPVELMFTEAVAQKADRPALYLKSFIPDETMLLRTEYGVTTANIIPLIPTEDGGYKYVGVNPDTGMEHSQSLESVLENLGVFSGLVRLDEGMISENPYQVFNWKDYKIFRRINAEQVQGFLNESFSYSKIVNPNFNPVEVASEFNERFQELNETSRLVDMD